MPDRSPDRSAASRCECGGGTTRAGGQAHMIGCPHDPAQRPVLEYNLVCSHGHLWYAPEPLRRIGQECGHHATPEGGTPHICRRPLNLYTGHNPTRNERRLP